MIGVNTSIFKSAGRKLVNLLGALKDRATYYENGTDSVAEKNRIDDLDILDKATILLTPTATSDARVHSVKTYTGDELVANGDFSDGETGWTITGAAPSATQEVVNGALVMYSGTVSDSNNALSKTDTLQGYNGHTYKLEITASDFTISPNGYLRLDGVYDASNIIAFSASTSTVYFTAYRDFTFVRFFAGGANQGFTIDNVSITDVSSDFDFDRASSATRINSSGLVQDMQSITDPELVLNGDFEELGNQIVNISSLSGTNWTADGSGGFTNNGSGEGLSGSLDVSTIVGETYKFTFDVTISGIANATFGGVTIPTFTTSGSKEYYVTATSSSTSFSFYLAASGSPSMFVNNISVQQVDPNDRWTVVDSDADNYVEFTEGFARLKFLNTSPITTLSSTLTLQANKTYELVVDVHDVTSGAIKIDAAGLSELFNTEGVTTRYLKPTGNTILSFYRATADVDITLASVSVKDITFSTDVDLARINYDSNGDNGHILLEPTSTNLVTYSEDFSQDAWGKTRCTVLANQAISPDGTLNADLMTATDDDARLQDVVGSSGVIVTQSIYVKSATGGNVSGQIDFSGTNIVTFTANNEWQRVQTTLSDTSISPRIRIRITNDGDSLYVWGGQVEALPYATSYIPSLTGSTVTRATETLTGSGNSTLINSTEGVLYAEIAALDNDGTFRIISISDGTLNNELALYYRTDDNKITARLRAEGSQEIFESFNLTATNFSKVAFRYKSGESNLFIDGVKQKASDYTTTSMPVGLNSLQFTEGGGNVPFYGKCKALAVFNEALEDDELELLTGITNYGSFNELAQANGYTII